MSYLPHSFSSSSYCYTNWQSYSVSWRFNTIQYDLFPTSFSFRAFAPCSLWNFAVKLTMRKLESCGYPAVKTPCDRGLSHFDMTPDCDRQTDGRTESIIANSLPTALCIASKLCWRAAKITMRTVVQHHHSYVKGQNSTLYTTKCELLVGFKYEKA